MANDGKNNTPSESLIYKSVRSEIANWLKEQVAEQASVSSGSLVSANAIDIHEPFSAYGFSSVDTVNMIGKLASLKGIKLPAYVSYDMPTIEKLSGYVAELLSKTASQPEKRPQVNAPSSASKPDTHNANPASDIKNKAHKVAIVGMACHFPGATNIEQFWQNLSNQVDSVTEIPPQRWDANGFYSRTITPGKTATKWGGYLNDIDQFDHHFFGIGYQEACAIDPQHRIALEQVWRAIEHAGMAQADIAGTDVGVFLGVSNNDYGKLPYADDAPRGPYESTANALSILSNRISYLLDFQGPSLVIDTACSSSLVAIHQACRSVVSQESTLAVAGGVNLILSPEITINFSQSKLMAPDGRCKTFDRSGNGYVRSEGAGIVVLKRLDLAEQDGDNIYAVISGSATNNDGRSNGLTAPTGPAQERVLNKALKVAGIDPQDVDYVEAHGTGTPLGDPIEVQALANVFASKTQPLIVGSVKTNIGHLETAAGVAGLIKTSLMMHRGILQPNLHFHHRNEDIDWDNIPIQVCTPGVNWPETEIHSDKHPSKRPNKRPNKRLVAGVTSIGFGGVNCHVVLEAYPEGRLASGSNSNKHASTDNSHQRTTQILTVSARSEAALNTQLNAFALQVSQLEPAQLADFCFSANAGRNAFNFRAAVAANSPSDMAAQLNALINTDTQNNKPAHAAQGKVNPGRNLVFTFTGQGSVYAGMGEQLYNSNPDFRACIDDIDQLLNSLPEGQGLDVPLTSLLWGNAASQSETLPVESAGDNEVDNTHLLSNTAYAQPAIFAVEMALYRMLTAWGIYPDTVIGHSVGEFAAACAAGIVSLKDALILVCARGRLMETLCEKGTMLALRTDIATATACVESFDQLSVATHNSPNNVVIAGSSQQIATLKPKLENEGIRFTELEVEHGFHSPLMTPMLLPFLEVAQSITYQEPVIRFISTVTGDELGSDTNFPMYWQAHVHKKVDFYGALNTLKECADGGAENCLLVELGPRQVLTQLSRQSAIPFGGIAAAAPVGADHWEAVCNAVCLIHTQRLNVNWRAFDNAYSRQRIPVPGYVFDTVSCWNRKPLGVSDLQNQTHLNQTLEASSASLSSEPNQELEVVMSQSETYPSDDRKHAIYRILTESVATTLGGNSAQIDIASPLTEIGVDSIALISIVHAIDRHFGVKVEVRQLFEELESIELVTDYILANSAYQPEAHESVVAAGTTTATAQASGSIAQPAIQPAAQSVPQAPALVNQGATASGQPVQLVGGANATQMADVAQMPGLQGIFSEQLQALSRLMEAQLQVLAGQPSSATAAVSQSQNAHPQNDKSQNAQSQNDRPQNDQPGNVALSQTNTGQSASAAVPVPVPVPVPVNVAQSAQSTKPITSPKAANFASRSNSLTNLSNLSAQQQSHLDDLIQRFTQKTKGSKAYAQEYRIPLADSRSTAGFRVALKELNYAVVCERGDGAHFWDIDGNEYVDMNMSFCAAMFGYNPPFINDAINAAMEEGMQLGPQSKLVGEVSRMLCDLTGAERVVYVSTGSEANMIAVRLARTVTKRNKVVIFRDAFHGQYDGTLVTPDNADPSLSIPGVPGITQGQVDDTIILDIRDQNTLATLVQRKDEIAAVLIEPVQRRQLKTDISAFVKQVRQITKEHGMALILDEVLVGFRCHPAGAQAYYGIQADIVTYGKIVGGGLPIGVVAGSRRFMDACDGGYWQFGDDSQPTAETTFVAGTHSKHPITMAAAKAVLTRLKAAGTALHDQLAQRLKRFADELNQYFQQQGFPISIVPWCSIYQLECNVNAVIFIQHLLDRGVFLWEGRLGSISTAHSDADLEYVTAAFKSAANDMCQGGFLPGEVDSEHLTISVPFPAYPERSLSTAESVPQEINGSEPVSPLYQQGSEALSCAQTRALAVRAVPAADVDFSISFFGAYSREYREDKYDLLIDTARYADQHGFTGIWVPERHFHAFGGYSPNPSVLAAALARETHFIEIRAGSAVVPIHHPVRLAEEWAVVDNISNGRVGIAAASGWHPQDFIFAPDNFAENRRIMFENLGLVQQLWQGDAIQCKGGDGNLVDATLFPMPKQKTLPVWITIVKNPDTYYQAGKRGFGILTNMMGQTPEQLAENISHYHRGREEAGLDPLAGKVSVLVHTYICADENQAKQQAEKPFKDYLRTTTSILDSMARSLGKQQEFDKLSPADQDFILDKSYQRYIASSALIGSPESCYRVAKQMMQAGITEFSCFVDFGIQPDWVRQQLGNIVALKNRFLVEQPAKATHTVTAKSDGINAPQAADEATQKDASSHSELSTAITEESF